MTLQLMVIGSEPAWPSPLRACSGYLVRSDTTTLLMDCGTGVFERLRNLARPESLTGIILTHLHFDHWADLIPFRYYLRLDPTVRGPARPPLYLPPGGLATIEQVVAPIDPTEGFFADTYEVTEYDPRSRLQIGDIAISFHRTRHPIEAYALRLEAGDRALTFSADTGWEPSVAEFARGSQLFLCESAFGSGESGGEMHLTAAETGRLATLGAVESLVLTHMTEGEAERAVSAAQTEFGGPISHATPGKVFDV